MERRKTLTHVVLANNIFFLVSLKQRIWMEYMNDRDSVVLPSIYSKGCANTKRLTDDKKKDDISIFR